MNSIRIFLCVALTAILGFQTVACRKRKAGSTNSDPAGVTSGDAPPAVQADPPKALPQGVKPLPTPPPKAWGERTKHEKIVQMDFWLNQHQFGDASQRSKVSGEIRAASMSPAERQELEEMRKRYGYANLSP